MLGATLVLGGVLFVGSSAKAATVYITNNITSNTTWTSNNVYDIEDTLIAVEPTSALTIASGTVVKFNGIDAGLDVQGALQANGTSSSKIYFTSINDNTVGGTDGSSTGNPFAGDWNDIQVDASGTATLNNAVVRYGGSGDLSQQADIYVASGTLSLSNSQVASSSYYGAYLTGAVSSTISSSTFSTDGNATTGAGYGVYTDEFSSGALTITSSTFLQNYSAAAEINYAEGIQFTASGDTASGTEAGFILYGTLTTSTVWTSAGMPYIVDYLDVPSGTSLTINRGVVIKLFVTGSSAIYVSGILNMNGTSTDPVYVTSMNDNSIDPGTNDATTSTAIPGDWGEIELNAGSTSTFTNAIVRYGGGYVSPYQFTNIYQGGGNLLVTNSQISSSTGAAIYTGGGSTTVLSSQIFNDPYGMQVASGSLGIVNSSLYNDAPYGVYSQTNVTSSAYAENNYWNATSGPYNANSNPSGAGTQVSDYVDYSHWLTSWASSTNATPYLTNPAQYKSDATTTISDGGSTTETTVVFGAKLQSTGTSTLQLQVEATTSGTFANVANATSVFVSAGNMATATLKLFPESSSNGNYHWQYRVVASSTGDASLWQPFSSNSANFVIDTIPLYTQVTSTYPSNSNTTGTVWWAPQLLDNITTNTIAGYGCAITATVEDLRSYGITTTTMHSYMSSTDVNPGNINDWLTTSTFNGGGYLSGGQLNWQDIPYYSETPSGTFRVWYQDLSNNSTSSDHLNVQSSTWVNYWLKYSATGTVPVILTVTVPIAGGGGATTTHFVPVTGFAFNQGTSTYTVRDPYFYNTSYLNQTSSTANNIYGYANTYQGAHVFTPTSTTVLPLYLEYAIDSAHTLLITDPSGNKLGIDPTTGASYDTIPNSGGDDDELGVRFLTIYTPAAGKYTLTVGGSGQYQLESFVADGTHMPIPQVISSSTPVTAAATYYQNYDSTDLSASTVQQ